MYGTVMAAALTVGLGAQTPSPQSPQSYPPPQDKPSATQGMDKAEKAVTLEGCLQSGDQATPTGTAGTTTPSAKGAQFVLKDATPSKAGATGTAGTAGASASIPSTLDLKASASTTESWSKYLNHKVEVKGTLEHSMSGAESKPTEPPSAASPSSSMNETFRVTSIREIAPTCSGSPK